MYPPGYMPLPAPLYPPQRPGQPPMSMPAMTPPAGMTMQYPAQPGAGMPPQAGQPPASAPGQLFTVTLVGQSPSVICKQPHTKGADQHRVQQPYQPKCLAPLPTWGSYLHQGQQTNS